MLANPSFSAYSTPDGNIYVSMGCLENLKSEDEVAAIIAHELSHVLLGHHSADLVSDVQQKGQALYEIGIGAKTMLAGQKGISQRDARSIADAQLVTDTTDKLVLPAWNRGQEREADLLGMDLLIKAGYSAPAMISMLEKLRAWEKANQESEQAFWDRVWTTAQRDMNSAVGMTYQHLVSTVSVNHPEDGGPDQPERGVPRAPLRQPRHGRAAERAVEGGDGPARGGRGDEELQPRLRRAEAARAAERAPGLCVGHGLGLGADRDRRVSRTGSLPARRRRSGASPKPSRRSAAPSAPPSPRPPSTRRSSSRTSAPGT